jgi:hypothetical protein
VLTIIITQRSNGYEVSGDFKTESSQCQLRGSYFPAGQRLRAKCVYSNGAAVEVTGSKQPKNDAFQLRMGVSGELVAKRVGVKPKDESTNGQGLDLSGTWEGPLKDSSGLTSKWTMVLKRTGPNEWTGTIVITQDPRAQIENSGKRVSDPDPVKFVARGGGAAQLVFMGYNYDATYTPTQIVWQNITFARR